MLRSVESVMPSEYSLSPAAPGLCGGWPSNCICTPTWTGQLAGRTPLLSGAVAACMAALLPAALTCARSASSFGRRFLGFHVVFFFVFLVVRCRRQHAKTGRRHAMA